MNEESTESRFDLEQLEKFVTEFTQRTNLTRAEISEVGRMARGFSAHESATECTLSHETIRARRKRIYRKLEVKGRSELLSQMLMLSLSKLIDGHPRAA